MIYWYGHFSWLTLSSSICCWFYLFILSVRSTRYFFLRNFFWQPAVCSSLHCPGFPIFYIYFERYQLSQGLHILYGYGPALNKKLKMPRFAHKRLKSSSIFASSTILDFDTDLAKIQPDLAIHFSLFSIAFILHPALWNEIFHSFELH
jgi:hypothetical protein